MRRRFAVVLAALPFFGCAGKEFSPASDGTGAQGGSAATGGSGGGGSSSGGSGGQAAGSGTGGANPGCSCGPGQYCRAGQCADCSDLSSLQFAPPELLLDHPSAALRFPRVGDAPVSLFYRAGAEGAGQLWYSPDVRAMPGAFVGNPMVSQQSGAVYVGNDASLGFNLLFDQSSGGLRTMRSASFDGALSNTLPMRPPVSPGGFDDYSAAIAAETSRVYWMSTRDQNPTLRTGRLDSGEADEVAITVPASAGTCPRTGSDATPWVTADGQLLLFRALPSGPAPACQPADGDATDLYAVPLDPNSGLPTRSAVALATVNVSTGASTETDPALSADLCTLYFASDGGNATNFDLRLYQAARR